MHRFPIRLAIVAVLAGVVLAGCHKSPQQELAAASAKPAMALQNAVKPLKLGDFDALLQHLLPPADYQQLRAQWQTRQQQSLADLSDAERQRFAKEMTELTAPDAKQKLFAKVKPMLDAWDKKYKQRVPMMVGIMRIMVGTRITRSDTMTGKQKVQARGVLDALATWAQNTDWGDKGKAKQAIGIVVDTARALDLKTLKQTYQLDYKQSMQRFGTTWNGFKQLLAVYGLSVNKMLDSIQVKTIKPVKPTDDTATVQVDYTILGKPMSSTVDMVRKGKRWYPAAFLKHWRASQAKLAHTGTAASAGSAPAPAASTSAPAGTASTSAGTTSRPAGTMLSPVGAHPVRDRH